jgi:saccharopine dehydrogenase-like NADP-dependent oxidoreductase
LLLESQTTLCACSYFLKPLIASVARDVQMRVGALPIDPGNALKYNLTWSTGGLINEYGNPCDALVDGQRRETSALEEMAHFSLDGIDYEAFNTSVGSGTFCDSPCGQGL